MKLKHPESKQTIEVDDDFADVYKSQGWFDKDAKPTEDDKGK